MKFTLSWLKKHLDTNASAAEISVALTALGLEVDDLEDRAALYAPFKVAFVEKAEKHPDADRLRVCTVQSETGTIQVVCGAPNARTGMKAVFAPEGSVIPRDGTVLKKGVIRGVESCGMLVSAAEMSLSEDHEGIIEVDESIPVGTPLAEIFGLNDPVFTLGLTPNRVDCAGVRGIARDLAAAGLGTLKPLEKPAIKTNGASPVSVKIEDTDGCPLFAGRVITGVKNGPSPEWLQKLLKSVGLRPISALVDVTNYISMDLCRPLHVYDVAKLKGGIVVRQTKSGESFEALNDKSYTVMDGAIAITDSSGLIGLGGIVGGVSTGCTEETTDVFLESAYFTPMRIAKTGRALGIESDARYRFERGIDPAFTIPAIDIATQMILDLCGGQASEIVKAGDVPPCGKTIEFDPSFVKALIGIDPPLAQQKKILSDLGFGVTEKGEKFIVETPSWRGDIWAAETDGRADLAEEIMRVIGLEALPSISARSTHSVAAPAETETLSRIRLARNTLTARGLDECMSWSFMAADLAAQFGANDNTPILSNPISSDLDVMRPSILPNLIAAAGKNHDRGFGDAALCEIGPVFRTAEANGQDMMAAGVRAGQFHATRSWASSHSPRSVDVYDAKADALSILAACGAPTGNIQIRRDAPAYFHPGRSGTINLGPNTLARFGEIHPAILAEMDIKGPVVGFEVFLANIPAPKKKSGTEKTLLVLSPLQPVLRDFAFVVDEAVEAETLVKAAMGADKNLIASASIFDVYRGKGVNEGKKSVALTVTLQPNDKTLTDKDIEETAQKIIEAVFSKTGGQLRG